MLEKAWPLLLLNLFAAALAGTLMRLAFVVELPWMDYYNVLHAHSHFAMMGWAWPALYLLLYREFVPPTHRDRRWRQLFLALVATAWALFVAFWVQGYAAWSIAFSTLFLLLAYAFAWRLWPHLPKGTPAGMLARAAIAFMALSTLALWAMPALMLTDLRGSAWYYMAVQFFLHFQFNGWFLFGILALGFRLMEAMGIDLPVGKVRRFLWWLSASCLLTYALAVTWSNPRPWLFALNSIGVVVQAVALWFFLALIRPHFGALRTRLDGIVQLLLGIALLAFVLKVAIQTAVVLPFIAKVAYTIRNFVIGFIHLILLGVVTCGLLGFSAFRQMWPARSRHARLGLAAFLGGLVGTESWLFLQGLFFWGAWGFLPATYEVLFGLTVLLPLGIGLLAWAALVSPSQVER